MFFFVLTHGLLDDVVVPGHGVGVDGLLERVAVTVALENAKTK